MVCNCGIKLTDCRIDLAGVVYAILNLVAGMAGNPTSDGDFSTSCLTSTGVNTSSVILDDIFLVLQRSTFTMYKIYNELFGKTRADFISQLSESCDVTELRYVRDMLYTVIKRRTGSNQLGPLVERKSGESLKDKLVKDIYNLYCFDEGSLSSLPKQMMRSDSRYVNQEVQTDSVLSRSMFATKSELDDLKAELLEKISRIKDNVLAELTVPESADSLRDAQQPDLTFTNYSELSSQPGPSLSVHSESFESQSQPKSRKILIAGDSLVHRIKPNKLKEGDIPSVKLTKKGDTLSGTIGRCRNFLSKHADERIDLVLLAGTNDLASCHVSPEDLIKKLDESINELTEFHNLHHIFLCQLLPRFDFHNINAKVTCFNELLIERFADTEEFVTVLDAVPAEFKYYHHDGLHLSDVGLSKECSIILSNLYKALAPASYKQRKGSRPARSAPYKTNARKHVNARRSNQQ